MTTKEVDNFNIWQNSIDPNFTEISRLSNIPGHWLSYGTVLAGPNRSSIIKPINLYVQKLVPPPKLISIEDNIVRLRQGNHAEIFLLENDDKSFYNVDRPWIRQYYNTDQSQYSPPDDCFDATYKFYVPWIIDENVLVKIEQPEEESPFIIYPQTINYHVIPQQTRNVEPAFVPFHFKKIGKHMLTEKFGKIQRQSPMFDMVFAVTDIMLDRIKEFYEKK